MSDTWKRVAIVTGATMGIGEATARKFVAEGYGVVGNARSADKLKAMEKELGEGFCAVTGDASESKVIDAMFVSAVKRFGREADIVMANAGRGLSGSVTTSDLSKFDDILKLNVQGAAEFMQKASRRMQEDLKKGATGARDIVVVGSVVGKTISPFSAVYGSTKFAVRALAEGLRREIGPKGIRVTLVEPGIVISGFQDAAGYSEETVKGFHEKFGKLLVGEDLAEAVLFVVTRAPHVHVNEIMVRPTGQDYP